MRGEAFLGRVTRNRMTYNHSNGRTYRSFVWNAYPPIGPGKLRLKSRSQAGAHLASRYGQDARELRP